MTCRESKDQRRDHEEGGLEAMEGVKVGPVEASEFAQWSSPPGTVVHGRLN